MDGFAAPEPEDHPPWLCASEDDLRAALAALPAPYRTAYERCVIRREPQRQIARDLNIALGTVGSRVLRARACMRAFLLERLADQRK